MLLFQKRFHEGLVNGTVTLTFRRWPRLRVKVGGRYRCHPIGVLEVDRIESVRVGDIPDRDARRAGFPDLAELRTYLASGARGRVTDDTEVHRIELHHGGDGDRVPIALETDLTAADLATLDAAVAKLDRQSPWVFEVLHLIGSHPRTAASQLARAMGRETAAFKADVVKLKRLGLTQSFEVGYEVSPRGAAYLSRRKRKARPR